MNSKTTGIWFVIAALLFAVILFVEHFFHSSAKIQTNILPHFQPANITSVQVFPAGAVEIQAERTNQTWSLSEPISYPAQTAAIEALLDTLQKLTFAIRLSAADLRSHPDADKEFGFENPQVSLNLGSSTKHWQIKIGNRTPPGDQVYLRVVGVDGMFVVSADWLKLIPHSANDWRSTALVAAGGNHFDSIILTNGATAIELHRDPTNHLWYMTRPLSARANNSRITDALEHLQMAHITQFITDNSNADLTAYGLQPADLDLWLGHGTNFSTGIELGKSPTNDSTQIFVRRDGWNAIVTAAKDSFTLWHGSVNDFRDPNLVELTAPVNEIALQENTNHFVLQREGTNEWTIPGEKFPVDSDSVQSLIQVLSQLQVADFVKDAATPTDLQNYGFAKPSRQITLYSKAGDTNSVIAELLFGSVQTNEVFVRRADEPSSSICAITTEDYNRLPEFSWEFRDRRIWSFNPTNVTQITLHQDGKTRTLTHDGFNKWSLAAGSQGIIDSTSVEQTLDQLSTLVAEGWVGRNITDPQKYGFKPGNLQITIELKNGEKHTVDFGKQLSNQVTLASVTLDGERWAFVFPEGAYLFVLSYLTIPANVP
jgi:Domain of unknown function (DUF4340)